MPLLRDILEHLLAEVYSFWPCYGSLLAMCRWPHRTDAFKLFVRWKLEALSRESQAAALYRRHCNPALDGVESAIRGTQSGDTGRSCLVLYNTLFKRNAPLRDWDYRDSSDDDA